MGRWNNLWTKICSPFKKKQNKGKQHNKGQAVSGVVKSKQSSPPKASLVASVSPQASEVRQSQILMASTRSALSNEIPEINSKDKFGPHGKIIPSDEEVIRKTNLDEDLNPDLVRSKGYHIDQLIGDGSFSKVYEATHTSKDGQVKKVAAKVIRYDQVPDEWKRRKLLDELKIGKTVKHPNVIHVEEVIRTPRRSFVFMDLAKTNLDAMLVKHYKNGMPEPLAKKYFAQIIHGVNYLHSVGIAHRDLKTSNMLLDHNNNVKITDFGFAVVTVTKTPSPPRAKNTPSASKLTLPSINPVNTKFLSSTSPCGSLGYTAPEVYKPPYDPRPADIWSAGCILFEMLTATLPFGVPTEDEHSINQYLKLTRSGVKYPPQVTLSHLAKELLSKLLDHDPSKRPKAATVCSHPWLRPIKSKSSTNI